MGIKTRVINKIKDVIKLINISKSEIIEIIRVDFITNKFKTLILFSSYLNKAILLKFIIY